MKSKKPTEVISNSLVLEKIIIMEEKYVKKSIGLAMFSTSVTLLAAQVSATNLPIIYTDSVDFLQGDLINTEVLPDTTNHHLSLISKGEAFNFIWVAVSSKGTVVKIDTRTGKVLGEYKTAPDGMGTDPSRTTVDANGNVWVANRAESSGGQGSVTKIGLAENGQCSGTNTSSGLGDILPWNNAGGLDTAGGVSTAEDDCILHYVRTPGTAVRTMAIDSNNDLWTGGFGNRVHAKIDGTTGIVVPGTTINYGCGGYGGLMDHSGVLWSASSGWKILRYDPSSGIGECIESVPGNYGLGIDPNTGHIWVSELGGTDQVYELNPIDGSVINAYPHQGFWGAQGVVVDKNSHVWVAEVFGTRIAHFAPDPNNTGKHLLVGYVTGLDGSTGVAVDADGKIWATNYSGRTASRIDPNAGPMGNGSIPVGAIDFTTVDLGGNLYNYSDMTGSTNTAPPSQGAWTVVYDSGTAQNEWNNVAITWNTEPEGNTPGDSEITVKSCSSEDGIACTTPYENVVSGVGLTLPPGQYLQIQVMLKRSINGESPILSDLSIKPLASPAPCRTRGCVEKGTRTR
jgi:streptogramin lyase